VVLHADRIRPLVAAAPAGVGGFYWRYVLDRDATGAPTYELWRERCVRNDGTFHWVGRVHEALVAREPAQLVRSDEVVVEHRPETDRARDHRRYLHILEADCATEGEAIEPRQLFYLGREYAEMGQPERALAALRRYLDVATWSDERYRAQTQVAALLRMQGRYAEAIDADLAALKVHPRWPDAYFGLAESYYYLRDWPKVIHWADIGRALPPPDTLLFLDHRDYAYRWIIHYTNGLYYTGQIEAALAWTRRALELSPDDPWHQRNHAFLAEQVSRRALTPSEVSVVPLLTGGGVPVRNNGTR
jgi:tetratricopeptide (TPR) repeat protein